MSNMSNKKKARELYESGYGSLAKVAESLGEKKNTVESWKKRDKKDGNEWVKMSTKNKKTSARKEDNGCTQKVSATKDEKIKKKKIKEISDGLTEKQRLFAYFYIQSFNGTQSAIKAGYANKSAFVEASRLLKNDKVKALLSELRENYNNNLELSTQMIINRHTKIAFSNALDFITEDGEMKDFDQVDGSLLDSVKITKKDTEFGIDTTISVKVEDRKNSLNFLTKYNGLDKVEVEEGNENPTGKEELSIEQMNDILKMTGC